MATETSKKSTKGAHYCCAIGCNHNDKTHKDKVNFYRFPTQKSHPVQRDLWIRSVRRRNPDGSKWEPRPYHRLCSAHFVSGQKSRDPLNPDFRPTIFGTHHVKKAKTDLDRFKRHVLRNAWLAAKSNVPKSDTKERTNRLCSQESTIKSVAFTLSSRNFVCYEPGGASVTC